MVLLAHYENKLLDQGALSIVTTMAIWLILYGPVYFLAWKNHFLTPMVRLLWCVSPFVITCPGFTRISVLWSVRYIFKFKPHTIFMWADGPHGSKFGSYSSAFKRNCSGLSKIDMYMEPPLQ